MSYSIVSLIALFYFGSSFFLSSYLRSLKTRRLTWSLRFLSLGLIIHLALWVWGIFEIQGGLSVGILFSSLSSSCLVAVVLLIGLIRKKNLTVILFALPANAIFLLFSPLFQGTDGSFGLPSAWLWVHVGFMILGEVMFFLAASLGAAYLIVAKKLRAKESSVLLRSGFSLTQLDELLERSLQIGWVLLSLGMVMGGFFAEQFWESNWWADAKILYAFFTWLLYSFLLGARLLNHRFTGRFSAWGSLVGFFLVLVVSGFVDRYFETNHQRLKEAQTTSAQGSRLAL